MNENPESAPALQPDLNAARKKFSLIGQPCHVTFGVELGIDLVLSLAVIPDHPELADYGTVWPWLISMVLMYGITMPAGMFIIKKAGIDGPGSDRKVTGKGFLIFLAVSFAAVYVGSMFSNLINGAI